MIIALKCGVVSGLHFRDKLQKLQNRAVRIITKRGYEYRSADIVNELGLSTLNARRNNQLRIKMYQVNNNPAPQYLIVLFCDANSIHDHDTRC